MGNELDRAAETATMDAHRASIGTIGSRSYLLVIKDDSSSMYPLPSPGVVTIGRIPEVDLHIDHASVSRRHARLQVDRGEIRISDLESRNGTRVNGTRLDGARALMTGDVIAIGEVLLVVHAELEHERELPDVLLDEGSWRRRLAVEVERAAWFQRPLAVLAIAGVAEAPPHLGRVLRSIDVIGRDAGGQLLTLLPEADPRAARRLAEAVLEVIRATAPEARIGIASCPLDATDPDNLVLAARAGAQAAQAGEIATLVEAARRISLGERRVVVCHPAMVRAFELLERLARSDLCVLIIGETGVGKENAAYAVHYYSKRRDKPFVALNCAALPEALVESQLFGHDKGAFTDASAARAGLFETASGGTLFLDEIGELTLAVQAKLLRAIETKCITRVGETRERKVDLRLVAATHRVLEDEVRAQRFREDLFHRLGLAKVHLPPLRDRRCEIPMLFREFIALAAAQADRPAPEPSPEVLRHLLAHHWPGNVRELKHTAEFVMAIVEDDRIEPDDLPSHLPSHSPSQPGASQPGAAQPGTAPPAHAPDPSPAKSFDSPMRRLSDELEELERQRMTEALARTHGVKTRAAAMIGMPIRTFNMKFKQYGI
ncbi:MAG TPA: sigma 54-interacting transcriptional regulator [Kofleriaceae bacterium]|nr:sigma 54-interacting transcriptional regulator [Kofleriaceae bacterium]